MGPEHANRYWLTFGGKLELDKTVTWCGIVKDSTLGVVMRTLVPTPPTLDEQAVTAALQEELSQIITDLGEKQFVFIGIASYVSHDNWRFDSVLRQQCPRLIPLLCWKNTSTMPHCDMRILAFATSIPEYKWGLDLVDKYSIAGLPFVEQFKTAVSARNLQNVCLVSGNFYRWPEAEDQYLAIGNIEMLSKCGFKFNP
jgi:hypothetical protein